jgi:hypothetical protein
VASWRRLIDRGIRAHPHRGVRGDGPGKKTATRSLYDTISAYLVKNGVTYDDLVTVDKGEDGKVTAIKTNIVMVNRMESEISLEISQKLSTLSKTQVAIPLGNILNGELFLGRGPHINIKISPWAHRYLLTMSLSRPHQPDLQKI